MPVKVVPEKRVKVEEGFYNVENEEEEWKKEEEKRKRKERKPDVKMPKMEVKKCMVAQKKWWGTSERK